jgi:Ca-activated chloride channel homolog
LSDDPAKLRQGVGTLARGDAPSDVGESLRLAMALVGRDAESRIVLFSDGCFDPVGAVARGKSQILFEPIGTKSDNLGIQALGTAQTPAGLQAYVGVKNFGLAEANSALTVYSDGKSVFSERVTVGPGQTVGRTVKLPGDAEVVQAKLDEGGFLRSDDVRWVPGDPAGSLRVLLVTKGNLFLETGLSLDARVVLDKSTTVPTTEKADSSGGGSYDLVIFDSLPEVPVKAPMVVTFGAGGLNSPVEVGSKVRSPEVVSVRDQGLLDGVSFEGVYLEDVYSVKPKAGAQALAKAANGPLVVLRENPKKQIYFAFDLLNGDFPLSVSFPIVLGNIVDMAAGSNKAGISNLVTGQTVGIPGKDGTTLRVQQPDGNEIIAKALNGRFTLRNFDQVGEYQVGEGEGAKGYLVNMISDRESTIAPVAEFAVAGGDAVKAKPMERFADLWKPLIAVMMGLLVLEWFVFMRRS